MSYRWKVIDNTIVLEDFFFFKRELAHYQPTRYYLFQESNLKPSEHQALPLLRTPCFPVKGIDYKDWRKLTQLDYKGRYDRYPSVVPICVVANLLTFKRYGILPRVHVLKR